jgi:Uma2 family endonuclease
MARKLGEYFAAGTQLVWIIDPPTRTVNVYDSPDQFEPLNVADTLDGGNVLPGFSLSIQTLFERASLQRKP